MERESSPVKVRRQRDTGRDRPVQESPIAIEKDIVAPTGIGRATTEQLVDCLLDARTGVDDVSPVVKNGHIIRHRRGEERPLEGVPDETRDEAEKIELGIAESRAGKSGPRHPAVSGQAPGRPHGDVKNVGDGTRSLHGTEKLLVLRAVPTRRPADRELLS